jgi:hypothetical protein
LDEYKILSPVFKLCELIEIVFVAVLIPVELNPIGLIKIFPVIKSLFTLIPVEVPIPTERFGSTVKLIWSPFDKLCFSIR